MQERAGNWSYRPSRHALSGHIAAMPRSVGFFHAVAQQVPERSTATPKFLIRTVESTEPGRERRAKMKHANKKNRYRMAKLQRFGLLRLFHQL